MKTVLSTNQFATWKQAYEWYKEAPDNARYICFGRLPQRPEGRKFFEPFLRAGWIDKNHLKFQGMFVLTQKGIEKYEEMLKELNKEGRE